MEISTNFGFSLPSRDEDDIADIDKISENFQKIDEEMATKEDVLELGNLLDEVMTAIDENNKNVNERISVVEVDTGHLKTQVMNLENETNALKKDFVNLENDVDGLKSYIGSSVGDVDSALDRIIAIQESLIGGGV